jgi:hypothetical protein
MSSWLQFAKFTRAKTVLVAVTATLAIYAAARSIWVAEIGPYDWPESIPAERNRIYSSGGFSIIVPEGWRSGSGPDYISAVSGSSEYWSTQIWVEKGISEYSQPQPLPENSRFQGMIAYEQQGIARILERSRPFFERKIFIKRYGVLFEIRVRTWRRPFPDVLPESLRRYIETFSYSPPDVEKKRH